ncbi:hypothetical protein B0O99DRAFT_595765 [Bisporella sp. PMI_857]|nr:hypothetical protein B0O99DRAFT_595765 [Bisporella sp. PMI_857]
MNNGPSKFLVGLSSIVNSMANTANFFSAFNICSSTLKIRWRQSSYCASESDRTPGGTFIGNTNRLRDMDQDAILDASKKGSFAELKSLIQRDGKPLLGMSSDGYYAKRDLPCDKMLEAAREVHLEILKDLRPIFPDAIDQRNQLLHSPRRIS